MEKYKTLHEALINEKIVKKGSQWQVQSEKGRNMGTYNTKKEAENRLKQIEYFKHLNEANDFDDEIPSIVNPFIAGSEEAAGYAQALAELAARLFGENNEQSSNDSSSSDPRLEPLPIPQKPLNPKEPEKEDSKSQKDIDKQQNDSEPLTQKEIADLVDKITKARDKARDVIDDYGDKVNKETADSLDKIDNELDKLSDKAKDAETEAEAQDIIDKTNKYWKVLSLVCRAIHRLRIRIRTRSIFRKFIIEFPIPSITTLSNFIRICHIIIPIVRI